MGDIVRQRGFTLAELLIVLVIVAILAGVGVPALRDLVLSNRQTAAVNELVTALQMARSHAITRGEGRDAYNPATDPTIVVCASSDGADCGGGWNEGWIVFRDTDGDGSPSAAEGGVLRAFDGHDTVAIGAAVGGAAVDTVRFRRDGRITAPTDFSFCDERGDSRARRINIDFTGRPSLQKASAGTCGG